MMLTREELERIRERVSLMSSNILPEMVWKEDMEKLITHIESLEALLRRAGEVVALTLPEEHDGNCLAWINHGDEVDVKRCDCTLTEHTALIREITDAVGGDQ